MVVPQVAAMAVEDAAVLTVIGLAGIGLGGFVMKRAFVRRRNRHLIEETPTSEGESVAVGPAEVVGTAHPDDEALLAPFIDQECLVAIWEIEEYRVSRDREGRTHHEWHPIASGVEHVSFYVDDGTGRLLVRPDDDVEFDLQEGTTLDVRSGSRPPEAVRRFVERHRTLGIGETFGEARHSRDVQGRVGLQPPAVPPEDSRPRRAGVRGRNGPGPGGCALPGQPREPGDPARSREPVRAGTPVSDLESPEEQLRKARRLALPGFPVGALLSTIGLGVGIYGVSQLLGVPL